MSQTLKAWKVGFEQALIAHAKSLIVPHSGLAQATLYALESPGKRLRPKLAEESASLVSLPLRPTQLLQFAVEFIHTFSLVHDDLPALDNDDLRRGIPTVHKRFGEAQALLAGDLLFQMGVQSLLQAAPQVEAAFFTKGATFFLECLGANGLIGGQSSEVEYGPRMTEEQLVRVQDQKTGALFRASILTPFYWMGVGESDPLFQEAKEFADAFGFAFQIADDLEDSVQDQKQGAKNILSVYGPDRARALATERLLKSRLHAQFSASALLLDKLK